MHRTVEQGGRRRVALYSHDTQGLGHVRRNISIASALVEGRPDTDILLLTGAPEATSLPLPGNTEVVTLPTLHKDTEGGYRPRVLGLTLEEVLHLRGQIVSSALAAFSPDLFVVDKVARGLGGELEPALRSLRDARTKVVLGLRDVLDSPGVTRREWHTGRTVEAVRDLFDEVWVYGDPTVYDAVSAYQWPWPVRAKVAYTGYLADGRPACPLPEGQQVADAPPAEPYVLCLVGGGQDGADLAAAFLEVELPAGYHGAVLTGPYMAPGSRTRLYQVSRARAQMTVHSFTPRAHEFIAAAAASVSMGGYNSVCELLAARCPTLVVPRTVPRMEQTLRAEALTRLGWVDTLCSADVSPARIADWLAGALNTPHRNRRPIDLCGLTRIPVLADALLSGRLPEVDHHAAV